jgi:hypothetical protein
MGSERDQWRFGLGGKRARRKDRLPKRTAQPFQPAYQIDGGADRREIQAIGGANITPQHLAEVQGGAKGQRRQPLPTSLFIQMRHPEPRSGHRAQSRVARGARLPFDDRKDSQYTVADKLQHLATKGVNRASDTIEPGVESRDDLGGGIAIGERREAAPIGTEQRGLDGLTDTASQRSRQHPRGTTPAEIGFQRRRQRGARREDGERCGGKARGLTQFVGLARRELTRSDPAEQRPISPWPDRVLMHEAGGEPGEPAPAGIVRWACLLRCRGSACCEPQRLDHLPALCTP